MYKVSKVVYGKTRCASRLSTRFSRQPLPPSPKLKPSRFKVSSASLFHPSYHYTPPSILISQFILYRPLSLWLAAWCYPPSIEASVIKIIESRSNPWSRSHLLTQSYYPIIALVPLCDFRKTRREKKISHHVQRSSRHGARSQLPSDGVAGSTAPGV